MSTVFNTNRSQHTGGGFSGFGTKKEEEVYDQVVFYALKLITMRLARFYKEVKEGIKFDPDQVTRED